MEGWWEEAKGEGEKGQSAMLTSHVAQKTYTMDGKMGGTGKEQTKKEGLCWMVWCCCVDLLLVGS